MANIDALLDEILKLNILEVAELKQTFERFRRQFE